MTGTRRSVETAVLVPISEWRRLSESATPKLKDVLLMPGARTEELTPPRGSERLRPTPTFA